MNTPRQTLSYLRDLFEARGLRPKNKLGQCFLIDLNLMELIVRVGELTPGDLVLEVGSGSGSMTALLAKEAGAVLSVELDTGFCELARETTGGLTNVLLMNVDILERKNRINPGVLAALEQMLAAGKTERLKLVSNLPYVVATPVITNLLLTELPFERMVITIQWELAERLIAEPSTKDYGALTVLIQSLADVEIVRKLPPSAFWPRPKVDSGLVLIRPNAAKRALIPDLVRFHRFVRDLYLHRRKNLRGGLLPMVGERLSKPELDAVLVQNGFDPSGRAEALSVAEHLRLCEALK